MQSIKIVQSRQPRDFWRDIKQFRNEGRFSDLKIVCRTNSSREDEGAKREVEIPCHRLVMASLSPMLAAAMSDGGDDDAILYLFDHEPEVVNQAVDRLYDCLAGEADTEELTKGQIGEVFATLGVCWSSFRNVSPNMEEKRAVKTEYGYHHEEWIEDDDDVFNGDTVDLPDEIDEEVADQPKTKARKRLTELDLEDVYEELGISKKKTKCEMAAELRPKVDLVREQLLSKKGVISVDLMHEPYQPDVTNFVKRQNSLLMAILGLQRSKEGQVNAVPLVISPDVGQDLLPEHVQQGYEQFRLGLKAVFGLSDVECTYQPIIFSRMELLNMNRLSKKKYNLKREFISHTDEQLRELLTEEVLAVHKRGPIKSSFTKDIIEENKTNRLELNLSKVPHSDLDEIVLVSFDCGGETRAYPFVVNDGGSRGTDIQKLFKCFFDILVIQKRKNTGEKKYNFYVPKVDSMIEETKRMEQHVALYSVVQEFLKDENRSVREGLSGLGKKVCEDCGLEFVIERLQDMYKLSQHRRKHFYENYQCECNVKFSNLDEKKSHVQLVHLGGYSLCPQCGYVAKDCHLKVHMEEQHASFTCEQCGKEFQGRAAYKHHRSSEHGMEESNGTADKRVGKRRPRDLSQWHLNKKRKDRYKPTSDYHPHPDVSKVAKKTDPCVACGNVYDSPLQLYCHWRNVHMETQCQDCGEKVIGDTGRRTHNRLAHPVEKDLKVDCKDCGKTFANATTLRTHYYGAHVPESERPFRCDKCDRRYDKSNTYCQTSILL